MAKPFQCSIVTPTETVLEEEVTYASLPAWDGQQGVMAGQSPVLTQLGAGTLRLEFPEGGSRRFLLQGGFAQIQSDGLTLLTEKAMAAESLALSEAEQELAAAMQAVKSVETNDDQARAAQEFAYAKVALAREAAERGKAV